MNRDRHQDGGHDPGESRRSSTRSAPLTRIDIADDRNVKVDMSLTSPNCPSAQELPVMVQNAVSTMPGVGRSMSSAVWYPPWFPSRMSEEARVVLNML